MDRQTPKLGEIESVKLLRRVFAEQFEVAKGGIQPTDAAIPGGAESS